MIIAVGCDRNARDVSHHEVRRALRRGAGIEHLGDGGVVHQGQGLALGFEARHHFARVQAGFDQLESDAPAHRLLLHGQPDFAHAAFTDFLEQMIVTDHSSPVRLR